MTPLGKPLVFYLKYPAEMNRLYGDPEHGGGEPDLTGLDDAQHVREMARTVGAAAYEQAADFLELCADRVVQHFRSFQGVTLTGRSKRATIKREWSFRVRLRVAEAPGAWLRCGVSIVSLEDNQAAVVPWLWGRGGRSLEEKVKSILGGRVQSLSGEGVVDRRGTVALGCISIFPKGLQGFDVDRDPLVEQVAQVFTAILAEDVKAIACATDDGGSGEESADPDDDAIPE